MKALLVLSVSAGAGHMRAADAIVKAAEAANPPMRATHIDLLSIVPKDFRKLYGEQYIKLVEKLPQLWSFLYSKSDRPSRDSLVGKLKRAAEKINTRKLSAEIVSTKTEVLGWMWPICEIRMRNSVEGRSRKRARRAQRLLEDTRA